MQENSSKLIVTLPVYKDVEFLEKTTQALEELTPTLSSDFVLLIAEDGSNSSQVVDSLKGRYANIVYIQNDRRLGRGRALREAWNKVQGDIYLYVDVDQATDLTSFDAYKNLVDRQREYALVTGSRYIPGAKTTRPLGSEEQLQSFTIGVFDFCFIPAFTITSVGSNPSHVSLWNVWLLKPRAILGSGIPK